MPIISATVCKIQRKLDMQMANNDHKVHNNTMKRQKFDLGMELHCNK